MVKVGDVLMVFLEEGESAAPSTEASEGRSVPPPRVEFASRDVPRERVAAEAAEEVEAPRTTARAEEGPVPAAPSTRRLARELGVDLHHVTPSGPGGRVTSEDVHEYAEKMKKVESAPEARPAEEVPRPGVAVQSRPLPNFDQWGPVERVPLRSVRRATARQMSLAWSQVPHVSHQDVADITDLEAFRNRHKRDAILQGGTLSLTVFALKAAAAALKAFPRFNSSLDAQAEEIVLKHYCHIGIATDTERGLIVPVIRDVDRKSILQLASEIPQVVGRTRDGKAEREDMVGGTFTVTNIGILGGTGFAPIVNYPQVAILGLAKARLQPTVKGDSNDFEIVPRLMLPLILGFDHRVVDGADAARFLNLVIELLEDPEKLLLMG
jgi:pyruvate dehydrogenase E2 component (dihydrolipoamide acetyltransferase)